MASEERSTPRGQPRSGVVRGGQVAGLLALGLLSTLVATAITPPVPVTVVGQVVAVGAVAPNASTGLSGPGVAELFGQGPVETVQRFDGPIRPRIVWQRFNRDAVAAAFIEAAPGERAGTASDTSRIGATLARGWLAFLGQLVVVAGIVAALAYLVGATLVGVIRGRRWRQRHAERPVRPLLASALVAVVVAVGAAALTVASAREELADVASLADLTGTAALVPPPEPAGPLRGDIEVAVIGDSTAAGVGNTPLSDPTDSDIACERTSDAYAQVLRSATGWGVANLACASATIDQGLLGTQDDRRPVVPPPQVGVLQSLTSLRTVIVSIGANDIGWAELLGYCYRVSRCDDQVTQRLMLSRLERFSVQYAQLLVQLSELPTRPAVIVVGYYDPFGDTFDCPALRDPRAPREPGEGYGFTARLDGPDQATILRQKVEPLRSMLAQLNSVLVQGAAAFGFASVTPSFQGHALCSAQPWVQGLADAYPFHPNAAGELAIAAAVLPQLITLVPATELAQAGDDDGLTAWRPPPPRAPGDQE
jgi:lysophospholipase L1-like esterase